MGKQVLPAFHWALPSIRFGERVRTRPGSIIDVIGAGVGVSSSGTIATTASGHQTAKTTLAPIHTAAGTSLLSTGPQSGVAATLLNFLGVIGLGSVAAWFAANPVLGGTASSALGTTTGHRSARATLKEITTLSEVKTPR